jgi:hypothetical protein
MGGHSSIVRLPSRNHRTRVLARRVFVYRCRTNVPPASVRRDRTVAGDGNPGTRLAGGVQRGPGRGGSRSWREPNVHRKIGKTAGSGTEAGFPGEATFAEKGGDAGHRPPARGKRGLADGPARRPGQFIFERLLPALLPATDRPYVGEIRTRGGGGRSQRGAHPTNRPAGHAGGSPQARQERPLRRRGPGFSPRRRCAYRTGTRGTWPDPPIRGARRSRPQGPAPGDGSPRQPRPDQWTTRSA